MGDTTEVGSYPDGASAVGALDMAGNVWEWVQDWYSATYYSDSPGDNPQGPESDPQERRVMRGGDFGDPPDQFRSPNREAGTHETAGPDIGFRCAKDVPG